MVEKPESLNADTGQNVRHGIGRLLRILSFSPILLVEVAFEVNFFQTSCVKTTNTVQHKTIEDIFKNQIINVVFLQNLKLKAF